MAGRVYIYSCVVLVLVSSHVSAHVLPLLPPMGLGPVLPPLMPPLVPGPFLGLKQQAPRLKPLTRPFTLADVGGLNGYNGAWGANFPLVGGGVLDFGDNIYGSDLNVIGGVGINAATGGLNAVNMVGAIDPLGNGLDISDSTVAVNGGGLGTLNSGLTDISDSRVLVNNGGLGTLNSGLVGLGGDISDSRVLLNNGGLGTLGTGLVGLPTDISDSRVLVNNGGVGLGSGLVF